MALVALTEIRHGFPDGEVLVVKENDQLPKDLPKEVVEELTRVGSVGEPRVTQAQLDEDKARLEKENAELTDEKVALEAQLQKALADLAAAKEAKPQAKEVAK